METSSAQQNQNVTSSRMMQEPDEDTVEYVSVLVSTCLLLVMGIYLVVCLLFYEYRVGIKNRQVGQLNRQRNNLSHDRVSDWMRWLCLIASILELVRLSLAIVEIKLGQSSSTICDPIAKFQAAFLCAVFTCIYLVLWLRQRKFYRTPAMLHLSNKIIQFFSSSVIALVVMSTLIALLLYMFTRGYHSTVSGCDLQWNSIWTMLPALLVALLTVLFQVMLLGLLIYPLHKHRVAMKSVVSNCLHKEIQVIKRVTLATFVAAVTDGIVGLITSGIFVSLSHIAQQVIYDVDVLVNILAVICSFADWRTRMAPFLARQHKIVGTLKRNQIDDQRSSVTAVSNNL
ncbi:uncharacterized protein LOC143460343 isoform X1 [Clavelina lepadiformis]|uniref:uncharacterized protein LOC143460343 isoform X1 n=1 Tax=Clavelina lepadiformis TaxID=159417 RepID=UPI004041314B